MLIGFSCRNIEVILMVKKNTTNLDSILNNLTNFPVVAQLQLILLRAFAEYFKMSHFDHRNYVIP